MNTFLEFIHAAAPWLAMGLLLLGVFAARGAARKKNKEKQDGDYGTEGMCLGMCFGLMIGMMFENHTGIGIALGMLIGLAIGMSIPKKPEGKAQ